MLQNDRFIRALKRQAVDKTPVWMMRQAGRYLPEYRKLRAQVPNFMQFCKTPELACEATMQPLARFDLDAAILFSDILTIPEAMGLELEFIPGQGPVFHNPIRSAADLARLGTPDMADDLGYVMDAVRLIRKELGGRVPLIGFAGSPWTLACYMVEGASSKTFSVIKTMAYRDPEIMHGLLQKLTTCVIDYLNAQVAAGAEVLMVFDSWGGVLTPKTYREFSLNYMQRIASEVTREHDGNKIPLIFFTKNGGLWLEDIAQSGCDAVGLDWTMDVGKARELVGNQVALQGNLDPFMLYAKPETISQEVMRILQSFGPHDGHVFNLGHGIDKDTPIENVSVMINAVHEYSAKMKAVQV